MPAIKHARTSVLDIAYEDSGPADGTPVLLMHGFPYDPRAYDEVVPLLAAQGCRTIVPYLRGYGPTRFLSADTMRSGEQAALGNDLKELMDALRIERAVLAGYDWGGRAACIVAALWPQRVRGLVTCGGYNMHDVAGSAKPADAEQEHRYWYQYYFCTPRGAAGLTAKPARHREAAVDAVVAELELRRCHLRGDCGLVRQSGLRRSRDPLLSRALRLCAGRPGAGGDRAAAGRAAADRRADDRAARRGRRHDRAGGIRRPCETFHRSLPAAHHPARRPQRAAGSPARDRGGGAGTGSGTTLRGA